MQQMPQFIISTDQGAGKSKKKKMSHRSRGIYFFKKIPSSTMTFLETIFAPELVGYAKAFIAIASGLFPVAMAIKLIMLKKEQRDEIKEMED